MMWCAHDRLASPVIQTSAADWKALEKSGILIR
jgi:hypothetical protein